MSLKITTVAESERVKHLCEQYGEVCEVLIGEAPHDYLCDNTDALIPEGSECAVVLVLPDRKHHNYEHQLSIMSNYVK